MNNLLWFLILVIVVVLGWRGWRYWRERKALQQRAQVEDALKYLLEREIESHPPTVEALAGALHLPRGKALRLVEEMEARGLVSTRGTALALTPEGRQWALHVLRAHRLWERYLADEARLPLEQVHREAHRWEHGITPEALDHLEAHLGHPRFDPHGDPIPRRDGLPPKPQGTPLTAWPLNTPGVITHLEDEPPRAFKQILEAGLRLGQQVMVQAVTPEGLRLSDGQREYVLPPAVAANVYVAPPEEAASPPPDVVPLSQVPDGQPAEVVAIAPWMQGFTRRRLMDLGLTPGAEVVPVLRPFFGDPRAYRVRGTTIALREDQAAAVWVRPKKASTQAAVAASHALE